VAISRFTNRTSIAPDNTVEERKAGHFETSFIESAPEQFYTHFFLK
jgi:hypothetical protein